MTAPALRGRVYDDHPCRHGEGALWHPERLTLFWFDIEEKRLHWREGGALRTRQFGETVSAAGWVDGSRLVVAGDRRLLLHDLDAGTSETLATMEEEGPGNRCNDGRADPWGGFWISTMGRGAEAKAGAIYRFHGGELRRLLPGITIPNAISFPPGGEIAYFADTARHAIWRWRLGEADGWPVGDPQIWLDLSQEKLNPDGAVVDAEGSLWVALWGAGRVHAYGAHGTFQQAVSFDAPHTSCPAFGGDDLATLFCTTSQEGLDAADLARQPKSGMTFMAEGAGRGQREHRVRP